MLMKKIVTLLFCISLFGFAHAGVSLDWFRTYTGLGQALATDSLNNVYTAASEGIIKLNKRDRFGNLLWETSFTTNVIFNYETPVQVHVDPQQNVIVVGHRSTHSVENGSHVNAIIVLKYTSGGNLIWSKIIDGDFSAFFQETYHNNVTSQMDANGNVFIASGGNIGSGIEGFNAIKVTKSGVVAWTSTKSFGGTYHFVYNIRLDRNRLALVGFSSIFTGNNALIWVLDTTGVSKWTKQKNGSYGRDVAFDKNRNLYMLTSVINGVSSNSNSDLGVYKFKPSGGQVWFHAYDFGGYEGPTSILRMPDKNLAILGAGNHFPGGSLYVDWLTMKIDTAGNLLWNDRYDEQNNNDENPTVMAVDKHSNIFVTGIGGPFPGGSNLGKRQWVTLKYLPNGVLSWSFTVDTLSEYITGVGIAIATDKSIFVLADVEASLIHLLDFSGSASCSVPTGITTSSITTDHATISWNTVGNASLYHLQYKPTTSSTWITISTNQTSFTITGLFPGTTYDFRVEAFCNSGPTGYSVTQQFTTQGSGYCTSEGVDATHEWIDLVYLNDMLNSTPVSDGGYADYTYLSTDLVQGGSYDITLSADMDIAIHNEAWTVWIDYNQDGDFTDAGEMEVKYKSQQIGWESHTITVPANADLGPTRMRVTMKRDQYATPCETFPLGEVEDYTVNIIPAKSGQMNNGTINPLVTISLYPNPAFNSLNISMDGFDSEVLLEILDVNGRNVLAEKKSSSERTTLNIESLPAGIYMLRVSDEVGNFSVMKWVKE